MANQANRPLSDFSFLKPPSASPDLTHGLAALPRGAITEILGPISAGRTAVANAMLATATLGGEVCAWIDCADAFDPVSAKVARADLSKLLWVQCGNHLDVALKAVDIILHSGGFGLIVLDLCDAPASGLVRIPLAYWYRLRNALENTPSVLLVLGRESIAKSCAMRQFALERTGIEWRGVPPFQIMQRFETHATSRKPMGKTPAKLELIVEVGEAV